MYRIHWQLRETYVIISLRRTLYAYYEIDGSSTDKGRAIIIIVFRHDSKQQIVEFDVKSRDEKWEFRLIFQPTIERDETFSINHAFIERLYKPINTNCR